MCPKLTNYVYETKIEQEQHKDEQQLFLTLPDDLIDHLGWNTDTKVEITVKLSNTGQVVVIRKA